MYRIDVLYRAGARRAFALLAAAFAFSAAMPHAAAADEVRMAYLFSDGQMPVTLEAFKEVLGERPELRGKVGLSFLTESTQPRVTRDELEAIDVLVVDAMNEQLLAQLNAEHGVDLVADVAARGTALVVGVGLSPTETFTAQGAAFDERAHAYWQHSGLANQIGLVKYALDAAGVASFELPEPQPSLEAGYYYPDDGVGRVFADFAAFEAWREARGAARPGAPRIAIGFYKANYYSGDMSVIDAIIAEIERRGAEAVPIFGYPGGVAFEELLIDDGGRARVDAALALLFRFSDFETARFL